MRRKQQKQLVQELKAFYQAPNPKERETFLRELGEPEISAVRFFLIQAGYIHKGVLAASVGVFALLVTLMEGARRLDEEMLWAVAACVPFLAMLAAAEGARSRRWGMDELELAAPFSLRAVWLARAGFLGILNLVCLLFGAPLIWGLGQGTAVQAGVFLLAPYLLSAFLNLWIQRKLKGRDALYTSVGVTAMVSSLGVIAYLTGMTAAKVTAAVPWELLLLVLAVLVGNEWRKTVKQTEEYTWNLS